MWTLDGVSSSLVVVYPILVLTAGLWSRARLVWFTASAVAAGYAALLVDSEVWRTDVARPADAHVVFAAALVATALLTTLYLRRFEALRRLYSRS